MLSRREIDLLAEFYETPMLSDVSKDNVRRALSEAHTASETAAVIAEVRRSLHYLLERRQSDDVAVLSRAA